MNKKIESIPPKVGQVWRDNDPRLTYIRELTIERIEGEYAFCKGPGGRTLRVKLKRFRPTASGYKLVKDAQP